MPPAFGEQLRCYRVRAGLTQEELAARVGLAAVTIGALERGVRQRPYPHTRLVLADALGLEGEEREAFVALSAPPHRVSAALTNLPNSRLPLIGREREVAALCDLIPRNETRLMTLIGAGGCGKTRLALAVAGALGTEFAGGTWLVELAPIADPALLPQVLAAALGLRDTAGTALLDAALSRLQRQPTLLVLDNCEHLVDACAELVEQLLSACPSLHILTTSREPLQLVGERQWRVPLLAAPDADDAPPSLSDLASYPAVELFVTRARAVVPTFRLTQANAAAVAGVCTRLGGLPLAVELAAARVRILAPAQILSRLDDALHMLTGGSPAAPTRQQTMRAALDWSYELLDAAERSAFVRLAVFAGSADLEAAEAVCTGPEVPVEAVLDLLTRLVDKSLMLVDECAAVARYRLLEPVRQYALGRLQTVDELERARAQHAAYYLALAEEAALALRGPAQLAWLDRLDIERDNLRASLRWAEESGEAEHGLRLAVALSPYWEGRGQLTEGRRWLAAMLALPKSDAVPDSLRAQALLSCGRLAQWQADLAQAADALEACIALASSLWRPQVVAEALAYLGAARRQQGAFEESARILEESLSLFQMAGDKPGVALALLTLGVTVRSQGDAERSAALLEESLVLFRALGDRRWVAINLTMLGTVRILQGDLPEAARLIVEGLTGHIAVGDQAFAFHGLLCLARVSAAWSQPLRTARLLGAMEALGESLGAAMSPVNQPGYERLAREARTRLGASEFDQAWNAGRALSRGRSLAEVARSLGPA